MLTMDDVRKGMNNIAKIMNPDGSTVHELDGILGIKRPDREELSLVVELFEGRVLDCKTQEDITEAFVLVSAACSEV
jgi:hypothetical protein